MPEPAAGSWYVYIIRSASGSYYTGITTDVKRRFHEHSCSAQGTGLKGAKALRGKGPLEIVYQALIGSRSEALKMEYRIKQLTRQQKEELVASRLAIADLVEIEN
ncbi:MAG: GIY-YIG nuclease family protein [Gammaproteobacteria bacterium]|nr:GIY-YIG nuclease family protein [Gammaproteobacteria bacterium]MDD9896007.1 GIY-YIG nuclease family protein [Gammaproteobacteria bacterium]MDD9957920.1 GIY-YIG nuclease family protein [Gammaproteobacteria bacterium]